MFKLFVIISSKSTKEEVNLKTSMHFYIILNNIVKSLKKT